MNKHSPGPWRACRRHEDYNGPLFAIDEDEAAEYAARPFVSIDSVNGSSVVACHDLCVIEPADAALLAAAPDLLATLIDIERLYPNLWGMSQVRAAIAKATGSA